MACGMCEAHVCDLIRNSMKVKKVKASARKREAVILSEQAIPESEIKEGLYKLGYKLISLKTEEK